MEKSRKDVRIMNKNRKIKRGLTTSLAVGMSVMMGAVPVFAAGTSFSTQMQFIRKRQFM